MKWIFRGKGVQLTPFGKVFFGRENKHETDNEEKAKHLIELGYDCIQKPKLKKKGK